MASRHSASTLRMLVGVSQMWFLLSRIRQVASEAHQTLLGVTVTVVDRSPRWCAPTFAHWRGALGGHCSRTGTSSASAMRARSRSNAIASSYSACGNGLGSSRRIELTDMARDCGGVERSSKHRGGEGRHRGGFHLRVQLLVIGPEPLVVTAVARLRCPVDRDDKARRLHVASDATAHLDVLRGGLWLTNNRHQAEPVDVDTDLDDVRGEADVDRLLAFSGLTHLAPSAQSG